MKQIDEYLEEEFIIWNSTLGIRDFVTIGEVKKENSKTKIWLDDPYDMVGPLYLDELFAKGKISFAACVVMTKENWRNTKDKLQAESLKKQQKIHQEFQEKMNKHNHKKKTSHMSFTQEKEYRKLLSLPIEGQLKISQIKVAYRKIAKTTHPDTGGTHQEFVLITEAKDALLQTLEKL